MLLGIVNAVFLGLTPENYLPILYREGEKRKLAVVVRAATLRWGSRKHLPFRRFPGSAP
jgi:hypothetical protein